MLDVTRRPPINGIDLAALDDQVEMIGNDPTQAVVRFRVSTRWTGQTRSESTVEGYAIGGRDVARRFKIVADEPYELLGTDSGPNPQELLMAALNACMTVGYVAQAALRGITLEDCRIETDGELDLRGFLGLEEDVPPGYRRIDYVVHLEGDGTREQYEEIHRAVLATSPNHFNLSRPIELAGRLA
jgi:uncharacterized OsmC-like protein